MFAKLLSVAGGLAVAGCTVFGIRTGTEEAPYTVIDRLDPTIEIRTYGSRLAAETEIPPGDDESASRNAAFRILAGYIFGGNRPGASIAMTTPVAIEPKTIAMTVPVETVTDPLGGPGRVMRFFMPAALTRDALPEPTDARVRIVSVGEETRAVLTFSGARDIASLDEHGTMLIQSLDGSPWQPVGPPSALLFDPPWTLPFLRRNEVAVTVAKR